MENFYTLSGRFAEMSERADALADELEQMYDENGGEVTADTEERERALAELQALKEDCLREMVDNSDAYAEIALNKAAQKKVAEAEVKAVKEEQKRVLDRCMARVNRLGRSVDFWKQNFDEAMRLAEVTRLGGAKSGKLHSVYYTTTKRVATDEVMLLGPYLERLQAFRASLPSWLDVEFKVNAAMLKALPEDERPEGCQMVESQNIQIR
jgi:hypothetical protein